MDQNKWLRKIIREAINEAYINKNGELVDFEEKEKKLVDFSKFPEDILKILEGEYFQYLSNFDWNDKMDEFDFDMEKFNKWEDKNKQEQFIKNLDKLILATTQDMILIKKQKMADKKLEAFEELIIPVLGKEVLVPKLSKYEELVLLNPDVTPEEFVKATKEAKNIIDSDGSINPLKTEISKLFSGDSINLPNFERFIIKHPEFKGDFNVWKKLFDYSTDLSLKELHAYRDSTPIESIRKLRNFLINFKKNKHIK